MPVYDPITNVMPLASMVTNAVVSAALCDQIRDDLVALYDGWWFKATRATNATVPSSVVTTIPLDSIVVSRTASSEGSVVLVPATGAVTITKTGIWLLGFHFALTTNFTGSMTALIDATDAVGPTVAERDNDTNVQDVSLSGTLSCTTTPQTVTPQLFVTGGATIGTTRPLAFWGIWLGDNP